MNRRKFLVAFIGLLITGLAFLFAWRNKLYRLREFIYPLVTPRLDERSPVGILSDEEMTTIAALPGTLIPTVNKLGIDEEFIKNHVNDKTKNAKGYLKEYRSAARLLDETSKNVIGSGRPFFKLSLSERNKVIGSILWSDRLTEVLKGRLDLLFPGRKVAFRYFVVPDMISATFQASPAVGWAIVGYSYYPGIPAPDLSGYTRPLEVPSQ